MSFSFSLLIWGFSVIVFEIWISLAIIPDVKLFFGNFAFSNSSSFLSFFSVLTFELPTQIFLRCFLRKSGSQNCLLIDCGIFYLVFLIDYWLIDYWLVERYLVVTALVDRTLLGSWLSSAAQIIFFLFYVVYWSSCLISRGWPLHIGPAALLRWFFLHVPPPLFERRHVHWKSM